jgi:hypothetical protein
MNNDLLLYFVYNMLKKKFSQKAGPDHHLDHMQDQADEMRLSESKADQEKAKRKKDYIQLVLRANEEPRPVPRYLDPVE